MRAGRSQGPKGPSASVGVGRRAVVAHVEPFQGGREQAPKRESAEGRPMSAQGRPKREQAPKRESAEGRPMTA